MIKIDIEGDACEAAALGAERRFHFLYQWMAIGEFIYRAVIHKARENGCG